MAKKRNPREARNPQNARSPRSQNTSNNDIPNDDQTPVRASLNDEERFVGNTVYSIISFDDRIKLTKNKLAIIKKEVVNRIFIKGLNSNDDQTKKAKSYNRKYYRYYTGKLKSSVKIDGSKGIVKISFTRKKQIILALEQRYGRLFKFSNNDLDRVNTQIIKQAEQDGIKKPLLGKIEI